MEGTRSIQSNCACLSFEFIKFSSALFALRMHTMWRASTMWAVWACATHLSCARHSNWHCAKDTPFIFSSCSFGFPVPAKTNESVQGVSIDDVDDAAAIVLMGAFACPGGGTSAALGGAFVVQPLSHVPPSKNFPEETCGPCSRFKSHDPPAAMPRQHRAPAVAPPRAARHVACVPIPVMAVTPCAHAELVQMVRTSNPQPDRNVTPFTTSSAVHRRPSL